MTFLVKITLYFDRDDLGVPRPNRSAMHGAPGDHVTSHGITLWSAVYSVREKRFLEGEESLDLYKIFTIVQDHTLYIYKECIIVELQII